MPDIALALTRIRPLIEADLVTVLAWRNHPDVRHSMFSSAEIALDDHRRWFENSSRDPRRHLLVFEHRGVPSGFVSFIVGSHPKVADWGFYTAPGAPRGTGRAMGQHALALAFDVLALHKVCGQALEHNERSIGFHRALGFQQEGLLREHHFDGQAYRAVICFGLLAHEWTRLPKD